MTPLSALQRAIPSIACFVAIRVLGVGVLAGAAAAQHRHVHHLLTWWDAQWYRGIAEHGYGFVRVHEDGRLLADYAFFPLYPALERVVSALTRLSAVDSGLLISGIAGLGAAWGIFAVSDQLYGRRTGVIAVALWSGLPVGIVETLAYSESLFTALAAWALYAVSDRNWRTAGLLACLAGLTRPVGLAVVVAVVVPALLAVRGVRRSSPPGGRGDVAAPLLAVAVAPLGWLGYLGWVAQQRGDFAGYFDVAAGWGNGVDGGVAFARWAVGLLRGPHPASGVAVCVGVTLLALLLATCFRQRQPLPLLLFASLIVVAALGTSGYFGSKPRYVLPAFPLLFPIARWLARQRTLVATGVLVLLAVTSAVYGAVWLLGTGPP